MLIVGNNLTMRRGDSDSLTVSMANDATPPVPVLFVTGDTVTMTVKTEIDGDLILRKIVTVFDDGKAIFDYEPEDTEGLEGREYVYDVEYKTPIGGSKFRVKTIIPELDQPTPTFTLVGDITEPGDVT